MLDPVPKVFRGRYFDGKTAAGWDVEVVLRFEGLRLRGLPDRERLWRYHELKQTRGKAPGEPVRLERGGELPETLVVNDPAFGAALRDVAGDARFEATLSRGAWVRRGAVAALLTAGLAVLFFGWGVDWAAAAGARLVPRSWEDKLGELVVREFHTMGGRCTNPALLATVDEVLARLSSASDSGYPFRIAVIDHPMVNALAAPGGHLVVFRGLLDRLKTPEELAGILAHEVQHVTLRHSTQALMRELSMSLALSAISGGMDPSQIAVAAKTLGGLRLSRKAESEADLEGMELMLRAGFRGEAMVDAFAVLEDAGSPGRALEWLSTHPDTVSRRDALRAALADRAPDGEPVMGLPDAEAWKQMVANCRAVEAPAAERLEPQE
ncbi:MAG: M48 family metallopeptidase [Myxococcales bacterium]